jgi:hypothetical protein
MPVSATFGDQSEAESNLGGSTDDPEGVIPMYCGLNVISDISCKKMYQLVLSMRIPL